MATAVIKQDTEFQLYRKFLEERRQELIERLYQRHGEIGVESGPEDEAALALRNVNRDLAMANIGRETRTLCEIELSLKRLDAGQHGFCGSCDSRIPGARLRALPWTRLCIDCAGGSPPAGNGGKIK